MIGEIIKELIAVTVYAMLGGYMIKVAIDNFKEGRYFVTGFEIMIAFYEMLSMAKLVMR